jgi:nitric oxide reductase large subunit
MPTPKIINGGLEYEFVNYTDNPYVPVVEIEQEQQKNIFTKIIIFLILLLCIVLFIYTFLFTITKIKSFSK